MYLTGTVYGEEKDVLTGVQVRGKRRMDRTGSGQREEKDELDRFMLERREKCAGHHGQILIQASRGNGEATLKVSVRSLENSTAGNEYSKGKSRVAEIWTCNLCKFTDFQYVLAGRKPLVAGCNFTNFSSMRPIPL